MFLIELKDGAPSGKPPMEMGNFLMLHKGVSFPFPLTPDDVEPFGYGVFDWSSEPEHDVFEKLVEAAPRKDEGGIWRQAWDIVPMNEEERTERTKQEWAVVRGHRNFLLSRSDWTRLDDTLLSETMRAEWASYRQGLRDITTQSDPFNIAWPVPPSQSE